jgi:hypothetical protein
VSTGERRQENGRYLPRHLAVAGRPAPERDADAPERGELAYQSARSEAYRAVSGDDPEVAFRAAMRCLSEADKLIVQVRVERTHAREEAANVVSLREGLQAERAKLVTERRQLAKAREELLADRTRWIGERMAAQATREARPKPRETAPGAVPDLDASLRPDPRDAASPADLMSKLRQYKVWAGNPGFRQIAAGAGNRYSATALHTALKANHLPHKQELIDAIVQGCGGSQEDRRMWAQAWRQLAMQPGSGVPLAQVIEFPETATMPAASGPA